MLSLFGLVCAHGFNKESSEGPTFALYVGNGRDIVQKSGWRRWELTDSSLQTLLRGGSSFLLLSL